ncbi:transcriptional regulator of yeast form adherence 3 [[Candida] railenensis]|uniref:Transcriptional regulator of yeast form adherence 3 n=1 Tax=[Candida] railenensis TaxID=45579 RepID=A0A9P0QN00_9ASCO|nr:transcriptional regulator of yeast form adherence 3 [[Candida] railenensis]
MKFAKELQQTLVEEEIPEEWLGAAIQYKLLKKCINNVVAELELLGLESNTLTLLLENKSEDGENIVEVEEKNTTSTNPVIAEYSINKSEHGDLIKPMLKITIDYSEKNYSDDHIMELGLDLKSKIEDLLNKNEDGASTLEDGEKRHTVELKENHELVLSPQSTGKDDDSVRSSKSKSKSKKNEIIIVLNSDAKFFQMLDGELENLDKLKISEEKKLVNEVENIGEVVKTLANPNVAPKKSDLYKWREVFKVYLDSEVFFRYNETSISSSERKAEQIKKNLEEFLTRVKKTGVLTQFKHKKSMNAFNAFVTMNYHLLKVLQFQSINSRAFTKILKKFDKQTSLGIKNSFPKMVSNDHIFMTGASLAQKICFVMQNSLLKLIPQLDDYMCPICCSVAFRPIRLNCGHVFCVTCLVKLKKEQKVNCPLCRYEGAIAMADGSNLDLVRQDLITKYFPLEVKEKMKERDKERYDEVVGKNKCIIQ